MKVTHLKNLKLEINLEKKSKSSTFLGLGRTFTFTKCGCDQEIRRIEEILLFLYLFNLQTSEFGKPTRPLFLAFHFRTLIKCGLLNTSKRFFVNFNFNYHLISSCQIEMECNSQSYLYVKNNHKQYYSFIKEAKKSSFC